MTWLLSLFTGSNSIIAALVAAAALAFGSYVKGRLAGAKRERAKHDAADAKARDVADDVQNDVGAMTPEQRREALRKWAR